MLLLRRCQASTCAAGPSQCHTPSRKTQREKDMDQQQVNGGGGWRKGGREGGKERREGGMEGGEGMEGKRGASKQTKVKEEWCSTIIWR